MVMFQDDRKLLYDTVQLLHDHIAADSEKPKVVEIGGITMNEDRSRVRWGDELFVFAAKQAAVVRVLSYHIGSGIPVRADKLLTAAKSTSSVPKLFRQHPAWGRMIRSDRRGGFWIALPPVEKV